jgi:putative nucleotidyltransferase with HDIG domain
MPELCVNVGRDEVCAIQSLATLPASLARVLALVQDDSSTALDLAEVISSDQALAMRVLRTVNSAYYGLHRQVRTISEAVVILGFNEVERLATTISVMSLFSKDRESIRALQLLWRHSVACSVVAGTLELAPECAEADLGGAHVAGLLHDVGKAALAQHFPEVFAEVLRVVQEQGTTGVQAEEMVMNGVNHAMVGAWLAEQWDLPPALVEAIALHHSPEEAPRGHLLPATVHTANRLCHWLGMGAATAKSAESDPPPEGGPFVLDSATLDDLRALLQKRRGLIGAMTAGVHC